MPHWQRDAVHTLGADGEPARKGRHRVPGCRRDRLRLVDVVGFEVQVHSSAGGSQVVATCSTARLLNAGPHDDGVVGAVDQQAVRAVVARE